MKRTPLKTREVIWFFIALGIFSLGVLLVASYRGSSSAMLSQDADNAGRLHSYALQVFIADRDHTVSSSKAPLLAKMSKEMQLLLTRYPARSENLIAAWRQFDKQTNQHILSWETTKAMVDVTDEFSQRISSRARDEARNGYWLVLYGVLGLVLLLARGFILVRELQRAEASLRTSEQRFAMLANTTSEGIAFSEDGIIKDANPQFAKLLGYPLSEIIGLHFLDFTHPDYKDTVSESILKENEETYEVLCVRKDKSTFYAEIFPRMMQHPQGQMRLTVARDITQLKQLERNWQETNKNLTLSNERWRTLATQDSLTGAYTRRAFHQNLSREIRRSSHSGLPFSVLMMDIDSFKQYNDKFGHLAGDEVLQHVVVILRETVREVDIVARFGGDEFVVVLVDTGAREAKAVAGRCYSTIQEVPWFKRNITASIGVLTCQITTDVSVAENFSADLIEEVLCRTDNALYQSKIEKKKQRITIANNFHVDSADFMRLPKSGSQQRTPIENTLNKDDITGDVLA